MHLRQAAVGMHVVAQAKRVAPSVCGCRVPEMVQHIPRMSPVLHNRASQALNVTFLAHHRQCNLSRRQVHAWHAKTVSQHIWYSGAGRIITTPAEASHACKLRRNMLMWSKMKHAAWPWGCSHLDSRAGSLPKAAPELGCQAI